jgi:hypothetical protein
VNAPRSWPKSSLSISVGGESGAVHRNERPVAPGAPVVDVSREQLLARAGFTQNHDRGIGRRHFENPGQRHAQGGTLADDVIELVAVQPRAGDGRAPHAPSQRRRRSLSFEVAQLLATLHGEHHEVGEQA